MNYDDARELFKNGDIVFFAGGRRNLLRRLITWFTGGPHYHVGMAFWIHVDGDGPRLMIAEAQPDGFRIVNLSYYQDCDMTVHRCPMQWNDIARRVMNLPGHLQYDLIDLAMVGLQEKFGIPVRERLTGEGEICSVVIAKVLREAGFRGVDIWVSPERLNRQLSRWQTPVFTITLDKSSMSI